VVFWVVTARSDDVKMEEERSSETLVSYCAHCKVSYTRGPRLDFLSP